MKKTIALALKDLRLMPRNRGGMFFTFGWPIIVTVLFGLAFGGRGNDGEQGKVAIALVDEDHSDGSRAFAKALEASFELTPMPRADAENAVRRGQRSGYIVLTKGFGVASQRMFYGEPRQVEVGVDPSRTAEAGMIEGLLMKHAADDMQKMFTDPAASTRMADQALGELQGAPAADAAPVKRFLGELKTFMGTPQAQGPPGQQGQWQPLSVIKRDVARALDGPRNAFDISFPQGVIWGLIGCMMTFGISLVSERTHGTLVRLRMAPLTRAQILGGKGLSCFISLLLVELMLLAVAWAFGVRPVSLPMLALAGLSAAICFVGFMMLVASLGKTEQTASGAAWAILMPLSLLGGAMVPTFVMPAWMQSFGFISPIRWAMLAIEGGVWRDFSPAEMVMPCAILITIGIACFALGTRGLKEA
ncbi:MAG TPA: ABC transporter permease [Vicinamibacterales bacterium]|nr:ABC transporter permease [Vicinamibacterales bacterium]